MKIPVLAYMDENKLIKQCLELAICCIRIISVVDEAVYVDVDMRIGVGNAVATRHSPAWVHDHRESKTFFCDVFFDGFL